MSVGQLPLGDPKTLQRMMQLNGGGGAIPPTSPVQGPQLDPSQVGAQAMERGTEWTGQRLQSGEDVGKKAQDLIATQAATPVPKMSWLDTQGKPAPTGFFHTLARALEAIGGATAPGKAIQQAQYGPGIARYQAETGARAKQIEELQKQQQLEQEPVAATSRMGPAYLGAEARMTSAAASKDRAAAYIQSVADRAKNYAATQDWHSATLDEKKRSNLVNEAQRKADEAGRDYRSLHKDATTEEVAQIVTGTRQQIANEAAARDPGVKSWLFNALGIDVPQIQGAPSPEFRETPKANTPQKPNANKNIPKAGTIAYDPQGKAHKADGTHPLPQGWSLSKPK